MPTWIIPVLMQVPEIANAIGSLLNSKEVQTIEQAFQTFFNHGTPGKPNSPTLSQQ